MTNQKGQSYKLTFFLDMMLPYSCSNTKYATEVDAIHLT